MAERKQNGCYGVAQSFYFLRLLLGYLFWPSQPPEPAEVVREAAIDVPGGIHNEQELWRSQSEGMLKQIEERIAQIENESKTKRSTDS